MTYKMFHLVIRKLSRIFKKKKKTYFWQKTFCIFYFFVILGANKYLKDRNFSGYFLFLQQKIVLSKMWGGSHISHSYTFKRENV